MNRAAYAATVAALALVLGPSLPAAAPGIDPTASDAAVMLTAAGMPDPMPALTVADLPRPWRKLATCEASGRPDAVSPSGRFHGLFQIEFPRTWSAHGGDPKVMPSAANVYEQYLVALHIFEDRGSSPWPHCGRFLREVYGR